MGKQDRKTSQFLIPETKIIVPEGQYDIYPCFPCGEQVILTDLESLAQLFAEADQVIVEGYLGVDFEEFRELLDPYFINNGKSACWHDIARALKPPPVVEEMIAPFLGGEDPLFGTRTTLGIIDFFEASLLARVKPDTSSDINIVYGTGASLAGWKGLLVYIDLPKNELQYRARAQSAANLGAGGPADSKTMYKRFYFVDWVVLNRHKASLIPSLDIIIDGQRPEKPLWINGKNLREALHRMSRSCFRARPWFEPGAWGGSWIRNHIPGVNPVVPNYAWSFELITPENGLLLESGGKMLEISFDFLMFLEAGAVLGDCYDRFRTEFPIRFDFLDTFDGGNLSVQCHPRPEYIKEKFGESFTQEEAYYILDTREGAVVNLGFREGIDPAAFRKELEKSRKKGTAVDIPAFVQQHPAHKHDLFLIPCGTVHGSGRNNLVLEISTTPYIFTFKMYDWLRPDLDGRPRDLNIQRAMDNLYFDRQGEKVKEELISHPVLLASGPDWQRYHLPTHPRHVYDVHRFHFHTSIVVETAGKCHVLNLVEGQSVRVETVNGFTCNFSYAETFILPAAAGHYRVTNLSSDQAMLVMAFVK
jgi:mannose-6-phosphate isomerase class I